MRNSSSQESAKIPSLPSKKISTSDRRNGAIVLALCTGVSVLGSELREAKAQSAETVRKLVFWGKNNAGQSMLPPDVAGSVIKKIAIDGNRNFALTDDGRLLIWGRSSQGNAAIPRQLRGEKVERFHAAGGVVWAWNDEGRRFVWGNLAALAETAPLTLPTNKVASIVSRDWNSRHVAVLEDGSVFAWRNRQDGSESVPDSVEEAEVHSVCAGKDAFWALTRDGRILEWGELETDHNPISPELVSGKVQVNAIACGEHHGLGITKAGEVKAWGKVLEGQESALLDLSGKKVASVAAAGKRSLVVTNDGKLVVWGRGNHGSNETPRELADKKVVEVAAGDDYNLALLEDGSVFGWGENSTAKAIVPKGISEAEIGGLCAGNQLTVAIDDSDRIASWGWGRRDRFSEVRRMSVKQVSCGWNHRVAVGQGGRVGVWGGFSDGLQFAPDSVRFSKTVAVTAGMDSNLALSDKGKVVSWSRQSKRGRRPFERVEFSHKIVAISAGTRFSIALAENGEVFSTHSSGPHAVPEAVLNKKIVSIASGRFHTLALSSDGELFTWGEDYFAEPKIPAKLDGVKVTKIWAGGAGNLVLTEQGSMVAWADDWSELDRVPPVLEHPETKILEAARGHDHAVAYVEAPASLYLKDTDQDGVADALDQCDETATGHSVDVSGCSVSQRCDCGVGETRSAYMRCVQDATLEMAEIGAISVVTREAMLRDFSDTACGMSTMSATEQELVKALEIPRLPNWLVDLVSWSLESVRNQSKS